MCYVIAIYYKFFACPKIGKTFKLVWRTKSCFFPCNYLFRLLGTVTGTLEHVIGECWESLVTRTCYWEAKGIHRSCYT